MALRCKALTWLGQCPEAATTNAKAMCVHEHLREGALCNEHLETKDIAFCIECKEGSDSHDCPLSVVELEVIAT
jgi:hypothetical protein